MVQLVVCRNFCLHFLLPLLLSYFTYLLGTYYYPLYFASVPELELGRVTLGHVTPESQVIWFHCNQACQTHYQELSTQNLKEWHQQISVTFTDPVTTRECHSSHPKPHDCEVELVTAETLIITLFNLTSCTNYWWHYRFDHELVIDWAFFKTPPSDNQPGCANYSTAPDALGHHPLESPAVTFAWGSCLGISPFSDLRAFRWLIDRQERTDFVVLLGDIVYTDIPVLDDYVAYSQIWGDAAFTALFQKIPFYGMYDDHEIINDWSLSESHERYHEAMSFYDEFVGSKNPPPPSNSLLETPLPIDPPSHIILAPSIAPLKRLSLQQAPVERRYYTFRRGSHASFFVLDTRQFASPALHGQAEVEQHAFDSNRTKLGALQKAHLFHWLKTDNATFKFLCSGVSWSDTTFKIVQDGWAAYRHERDEIFDFILSNQIAGVILLSADLHYACVFHFKRWNLFEITVSPIQSFGLPHWIGHSNEEVTIFTSPMWMHIGEVNIYSPVDAEPYVNVSIWRYMYGSPKQAYQQSFRISEMRPQDLVED